MIKFGFGHDFYPLIRNVKTVKLKIKTDIQITIKNNIPELIVIIQ